MKTQKIALVTGSAQRIGKSIALHLAKNGWKLALHFNNSQKEIIKTKSEVDQFTESRIVNFNLENIENFKPFLEEINTTLGKPTLLINNASAFDKDIIKELDAKFFERQMRVNCLAPTLLAQDFFVNNSSDQLNIINLTDYAAKKVNKSFFSYYVSKNALDYCTEILAAEFAPRCRVNSLALGYVLKANIQSNIIHNSIIENTPLKKPVAISDINNAIDFILSSESVTGATINIDSGANVKPSSKLS